MSHSKYLFSPLRMDDEPEDDEPKEKGPDLMLLKKLEKYFFETRTVQLWRNWEAPRPT